ncbi:hypothetical protein [uncultured Methanolobus sp.]|uniref:hypothetical protein n=1 Tax=uncultured Methanolobus sp. TaxID=218300 RepID=UPI002AAAF693|nr:hypothetical protein [uncultured Methanolobus sp.]
MNKEFQDMINSLPGLQDKLENSRSFKRDNLQGMPECGIYVFYKDEKPLFVGRSDKMKKRIMTQARKGSTHHSAPFAFLLARNKANAKGMDTENKKRDELVKDPMFNELFIQSKEEVSKMSIKCVAVEDPIIQTIFQVYAAMQLDTPYNKFETH